MWHGANSSGQKQPNSPAPDQSNWMHNPPPYSHQQQQPYQNQPPPHSSNPSHPVSSYPTFADPIQRHPYQQNPHQATLMPGHLSSFQYGQIPYNPSPYPSAPVRFPVSFNSATYSGQQYTSFPSQYHPVSYCGATTAPGVPQPLPEPVNLISNPNFEAKCWSANGDTVEINTAPWDIISTGGDGWRLEKRPMGSKMDSCPAAAGPGAHCIAGSFEWCKRSQIVDLEQKGFPSHQLDQEKPRIQVYVWFVARSDCDSEFYVNVSLLDKDKKPIDHFNSGTLSATSEWQKVEHSFYNYPRGTCYVKYEDGSKDKSYWAGFFGAKVCQPTVLIHSAHYKTSGGPPSGYTESHGYPRVAIPRTQYPGTPAPGPQYPAAPAPGPKYPGAPASGPQYPRAPAPGPQYPGAPAPGPQYPGAPASGPQYPGAPAPGPKYPGAPASGPQYPGAPASGPQYPGAPAPGPQYPGAPAPGPQYPGAPAPGPQYPGAPAPGPQYPGAYINKDPISGSAYSRNQITNLIKNPSFTPLEWKGNVCYGIDLSPWVIEKNEKGYNLEKKPLGSGIDKYPKELDGFELWCISTSHSFSERKQVIDLTKHGYNPCFLDEERPSIVVHEWFTSRSDCEGRYFLKVALLDQQRNPIPGFSYDTGIREAPSSCWVKEEYIFTNIPIGVRFVEFKDGGSDCKNWAGFYGAKMVGAFVGVLTNTLDHHDIAFTEKPKKSRRNLLKNGNMIPKTSWNGNVTSDIEFEPWEIIENGGDGIHLEKSPEGTDAGPFPRDIGQNVHCIATSYDWFKRVQIIDLLKNGVFPHVFKNPDLMIYACEWFASRNDNEGEYYLRVSLLDDRKQEIPGCTFESHVNQAPSDEWEKVDYTFYPVPDSACYVRFEDGGRDVKYWAGKYGVKMIGAAVYAGQKHDKEDIECTLM